MDLPTRTKQKKAESESYAILLYKLRHLGIFRNLTESDYGIDFEIELVSDGSVTGRYLKAQVKSAENINVRKSDAIPTVGGRTDTGSPRRSGEGRCREMVADHQAVRDQSRPLNLNRPNEDKSDGQIRCESHGPRYVTHESPTFARRSSPTVRCPLRRSSRTGVRTRRVASTSPCQNGFRCSRRCEPVLPIRVS